MIQRILVVTFFITILSSCKKEPGEGGRATIIGKVIVDDYDNSFTILRTSYAAIDQNIFITYGDDNTIGKQTKTSFDGSFKFDFLRTGKYKIFAVSKDSTEKIASKTIAVMQEVTITDKKQVVNLTDIHIID